MVRPVGERTPGEVLLSQAKEAFSTADATRAEQSFSERELEALGTFVTVRGSQAIYPLKLESLDRKAEKKSRFPKWMLMSVHPVTDGEPEQAIVWVSDRGRREFLKLFTDYLDPEKLTKNADEKKWETAEGNPKNRDLVANITEIRRTILLDLWQSDGEAPQCGTRWWELWLTRTVDAGPVFNSLAALHIHTANRVTVFPDRNVLWVKATWDQLQILPFTNIPLAEIRRPSFLDSIEDLTRDEQNEWVDELAARVTPSPETAPAVCHLDTGVARTHVLLADSLAPGDLHTVVGSSGFDVDGHGTKMAGIALYGNLDDVLLTTDDIVLRHRLESVRILPSRKRAEKPHDPLDYGTVTSQAVSTAEISAGRSRVFCMPVTAPPDKLGDPTLWSATVDALCAGTDVVRDKDQLCLVGAPDPGASRLIVISAGNTELPDDATHFDPLVLSDTTCIADPAQAWNALTVGAFADLTATPSDPQFVGWTPVAVAGELSPHSRTSVSLGRTWPIKPDLCMEGGNVLTDGKQLNVSHPLLSVRTTGIGNDRAITSANATSSATAAASRLAALSMAEYPDYWPETIRGLLVHASDWTPVMRDQIKDKKLDQAKRKRLALLRRYGWGVPTEEAVLRSSRQAVTMVVQDEFVPFSGSEFKMRHFRLHDLPWPKQVLQSIGAGDVSMKITLSYYIEPNSSRRGWSGRYSYASHMLRFELKAPGENDSTFASRVNNKARDEESGMPRASSGNDRWLIGPNQRNTGSLHQDIWDGIGADLAQCDKIAVYPVGGWWKNNKRRDREDLLIRYALLVSLTTHEQGIDLYTPIANELHIPTPVAISAT